MSPTVKPPAGARAAKTAATRARSVAAAYDLFCERGYDGTKLTEVAERAGVSVQTLYFTFGNKQQLLHEAFVYAVLGSSGLPPEAQPWFAKMKAATTGREALAAIVDGAVEIFERVRPLVAAARAAAEVEANSVWQRQQAMRRDAYEELLRWTTSLTPLRPGLETSQALDTMLVLLGPDVYHLQRVDNGWSRQTYTSWVTDSLATLLLAE